MGLPSKKTAEEKALSPEEGAKKLYKLLYGDRPPARLSQLVEASAPAPAKPKPTGPVNRPAIIGIASEAELRERVRLAAEKKAAVKEKTPRRHARNYKGPRTVICPCGVPFQVPSHYGKDAKKYCSSACRKKYYAKIMYRFTPEMDARITEEYRNKVGFTRTRVVRDLAESWGFPRYAIGKRALKLGLVPVVRGLPRAWSEIEKETVVKWAFLSIGSIRKKLKAAGFVRSENAIKIFITRQIGFKPKESYSATSLAGLLGIDNHAVLAWINKGWLKAVRRGTERTALQGGDSWTVRPEDVREFVINHLALIDIRKVDKFWLVELLTGREIPV